MPANLMPMPKALIYTSIESTPSLRVYAFETFPYGFVQPCLAAPCCSQTSRLPPRSLSPENRRRLPDGLLQPQLREMAHLPKVGKLRYRHLRPVFTDGIERH